MATKRDEELKRLDALIADAERRIERQRDLIERSKLSGRRATEAENTLGLMLSILDALRNIKITMEWRDPTRTRH